MANFDEDIKRITDEILSDGTVDQIIREKVTDGIEKAIASSFNYGKLEKAVKERVEQVLVPFIENYDMSAYIVKLDTVLTEIVNKSVLMDNKQMLENFQYLMKEPQITEMKLTDLFKEFYKTNIGEFTPEKWLEVTLQIIQALMENKLLDEIKEYVADHCVWLKNDKEIEEYSASCLASGTYMYWEGFKDKRVPVHKVFIFERGDF